MARAAAPRLCLFVAALAVVVEAVAEHGGRAALSAVLPKSTDLVSLLAVAGVAAVLANLVNNLPATLLLLSVLGPHAPVVLTVLGLLTVPASLLASVVTLWLVSGQV